MEKTKQERQVFETDLRVWQNRVINAETTSTQLKLQGYNKQRPYPMRIILK